jgi:hypothetical protein
MCSLVTDGPTSLTATSVLSQNRTSLPFSTVAHALQSANERKKHIQRRQVLFLNIFSVSTVLCHVVSLTDPWGRILGFLDRSPYFFFQVAA